MIKNEELKGIVQTARRTIPDVTERDVVFLVLCDVFANKDFCHKAAYGKSCNNIADLLASEKTKELKKLLEPFGVGIDLQGMTKDENTQKMIGLLTEIQSMKNENLGSRDRIALLSKEADIRVKLNEKFGIDEGTRNRRIITVPQKHDTICRYTQRECSLMPSKKACMEYYNLKEK